jgi:serine protease
VAASDRSGDRAWYSNYGSLVDVTAPGGDLGAGKAGGIYSTLNAGKDTPGAESYGYYDGTSMAAPHVAGVAALLLASRPGMTPAQVEAHLRATARALPGTCSGGCGAGLVDAAAALRTLAAGAPKIGGTPEVGKTLTAAVGGWNPAPASFTFQWFRSGQKIAGATGRTYRLTGADAGKRISVKVAGLKTGYVSASRTSGRTKAIAKGTLRTGTVTVSGTRKVGSKLTAKAGTWTAGTKRTYRWYRSGTRIKGATKSTYRLVKADRKRTIKVRVTGTKTGYTTARKYSKATSRIR